jgi:hypothetical protein
MKKIKELPKFKSEKAEKEFWLKNDSTEYIDWDKVLKNPLLFKCKKEITLR